MVAKRAWPKPNSSRGRTGIIQASPSAASKSRIVKYIAWTIKTKPAEMNSKSSKYASPIIPVRDPSIGTAKLEIRYGREDIEPA